MELLLFVFWLCLSTYFLTLLLFNHGVNNRVSGQPSANLRSASVIIAIRNGETSLVNLISDLQSQNYAGKYEVILVDDNSSDNTAKIIEKIVGQDHHFKHVNSIEGKVNLSLKKRALDAGIQKAAHDILLFTDVDCRLTEGWISAMVSAFTPQTEFVVGLSKIIPTESLVSRFQSLDFQMLETASLGMASIGKPWACTGQNQAYRKSLYEEVGGFDKISSLVQGDDTLFLQICRNNSAHTSYIFYDESIVISRTENNLTSLLKQRMRWSGDASRMLAYNPAFFVMIIATFLTNGFFCIIFFLDFPVYHAISGLILKFIGELTLYKTGNVLFNKADNNYFDFSCWFLLQIPFVLFMGLTSFWAQPFLGWQDRKA